MPHIIILINEKLDELIADGTEGPLVELRVAANAGDIFLLESQKDEVELHEQMESLQTWLTDAYSQVAGVGATAEEFTTTLNALIGQ